MAHVIDLRRGHHRFIMPDTVLTPDDWIADVRPKDRKRKPFRLGLSHFLSYEQACAKIEHMLAWRNVGVADVVLKRRSKWGWRTAPTHPQNLARYRRDAND